MFCRICGKMLLDDSRFCQYCGTAVHLADVPAIDATLLISAQEAANGVSKKLKLKGMVKPLEISLPKRTQNGQIFCLRRVKQIDADGNVFKKDIYLKIKIEEKKGL